MANLKSLAKDTAIYGLSSIVGRFLNYLLVPLYTTAMTAASGSYGIVTNVYAYTALLLVLLTFGMETSFFRFVNKKDEDPERVYSTTLWLVGGTGAVFSLAVWLGLEPLSALLGYEEHPEYIGMMFVCVAIDAFQCIPFAYLRHQNRPVKFAVLKLSFIFMNIGLNLLYYVGLPALYALPQWHDAVSAVYDPQVGVGYVFRINLFCTAAILPLFWQELTGFRPVFDRAIARRMLRYGWPILVLGLAGILNQTADKILYPLIKSGPEGRVELGIYGACVKVAMIMALITQAFRYAYEPFVFRKNREGDNRDMYARAMKYFLMFTLLAFLTVVGYMDLLRYLIAPDYWEGLRVVPIVMVAEIMMGIYFNLSFWYKLTDRTIWGAWFSGIGCGVLLLVNVLFIPHYGYMACAWAGVAGYGTAMILSYVAGQHYYPIRYPMKSMLAYVGVTAILYGAMLLVPDEWPVAARLAANTAIIGAFVAHMIHYDLPLRDLPVIGRYFQRK